MSLTHPNLVANGDIRPFRFVKQDDSGTPESFMAKEADANEVVIGISGEGTNYPPLDDLNITALAARAGQQFKLNGNGEICLLQAGAPIAAGKRLKSDADGKGVEVATTGTTIQNYGAVALESATAADQIIRVQVQIGNVRPALA
jgi:hypothetical protein